MNDTLQIGSARAAAALDSPQSRRIVLALAANEQSLQELANVTGLSLSLLHYHVGRMRRLGLVKIARVTRRSGRAVKRYRAVARKFFVPAHLAGDRAGEAMARELRAALAQSRARGSDAGILYFVDDTGAPRISRVSGRRTKDCAFETWLMVSLTPQDAKILGGEIRALLARHSRSSGGRRVLAYCAFAERTKAARPARRVQRRSNS